MKTYLTNISPNRLPLQSLTSLTLNLRPRALQLRLLLLSAFFTSTILLGLTPSKAHAIVFEGKELVSGKTEKIEPRTNKKGLVVVFVGAKCPCSMSHASELKSLATDFPDFDFVGIHSNQDEDLELSKTKFSEEKYPFPVLQDSGAKIADELKAYKTPHAFLLGPDGKILYQGGVTNSADAHKADEKLLRSALSDVLAGKSVQKPEGRTLGCVIARKAKNVW